MEFHIYTIYNIYYICFLLFVGIFYNYKTITFRLIIKHYLYFIFFHILFNLYKYMEVVIKYILYNTMIGISIIIISFSMTFTLRK
jgi:hypothetical protein